VSSSSMNRKKEKMKQELKIRILGTSSHLELTLNPVWPLYSTRYPEWVLLNTRRKLLKYTTQFLKYEKRVLLNTRPNFFKVITNFYSNKVSFCNGFLHNLHKSQFFFFDCKNYLKKRDLHWMFLPWLALQGLAFWLPWFWHIQDRS